MRAAPSDWLLASSSRLEIQERLLEGAGGRLRRVTGEHVVHCTHGRDVRPYERLFESLISSFKSRALLLFAFSPQPSALYRVPA